FVLKQANRGGEHARPPPLSLPRALPVEPIAANFAKLPVARQVQINQAATCAFRFRRQPSRPNAPRLVAKSGRAAGTGVLEIAPKNLTRSRYRRLDRMRTQRD